MTNKYKKAFGKFIKHVEKNVECEYCGEENLRALQPTKEKKNPFFLYFECLNCDWMGYGLEWIKETSGEEWRELVRLYEWYGLEEMSEDGGA